MTKASLQFELLQKLKVNLPVKISTNKIYAGIHWRERVKHKESFGWEFLARIKEDNIQSINSSFYPISLYYYFSFKKRTLDSSNCSYMAKICEDCLIENKIIKDDSTKFVKGMYMESSKGDKDEVLIYFLKENEN